VLSLLTTTVYDAQVTNHNGGNADEGITYKIKGTNNRILPSCTHF
jgi:hypothetical protein